MSYLFRVVNSDLLADARVDPSRLSARITTSINLPVFVGGFVLQWAMNVIIVFKLIEIYCNQKKPVQI